MAQSLIFREMYRNGALESELVSGSNSFLRRPRLNPSPGTEKRILDEIARAIPPEWYADDYDALLALLEQLHRRRHRVPDLILEANRCNRQPFPNWM